MRWIGLSLGLSIGLAGMARLAPAGEEPAMIAGRLIAAPIVLDQAQDYVIERMDVRGGYDVPALALRGDLPKVVIRDSRFGYSRSGGGPAAAVMAQGANVGRFSATDCEFYDAENQVFSLVQGHFGHVVIERCTFRTSDSFLREIVERNPWRNGPPVAEFANIERLELLDVAFENTRVIIHPSVKVVILRGDIRDIEVMDPGTQVRWLAPEPHDDAVLAAAVG